MGDTDNDIIVALWANIVSWIVATFFPALLPQLIPKIEQEVDTDNDDVVHKNYTKCVSIARPGGSEQLRVLTLKKGIVTVGYNVVDDVKSSFTMPLLNDEDIPSNCIILRNEAFSINYADCCIRWGLYDSAKEFVGWPIVPGFDVAGVVERVSSSVTTHKDDEIKDRGADDPQQPVHSSQLDWKPGDRVFGCSLFGAYSSKVCIPKNQLRKIPPGLTMQQAASLPTVALTALYALYLAGHYPPQINKYRNKSILIHSAAGGVGSMLVQMSKILGLYPVVGVVGRTAKVEAAKALGCDVVIDKSACGSSESDNNDLWTAARNALVVPTDDNNNNHHLDGYGVIMDANGVSTLGDSYKHLGATGRLIIYGFHTNLPMGRAALSPRQWMKMGQRMISMPKFDPMDMGSSNKGVLAFNLSFFSKEIDMLSSLFDQICDWLVEGKIQCPRIVDMEMNRIVEGHELIQSGRSVGKIVMNTTTTTPPPPTTTSS